MIGFISLLSRTGRHRARAIKCKNLFFVYTHLHCNRLNYRRVYGLSIVCVRSMLYGVIVLIRNLTSIYHLPRKKKTRNQKNKSYSCFYSRFTRSFIIMYYHSKASFSNGDLNYHIFFHLFFEYWQFNMKIVLIYYKKLE